MTTAPEVRAEARSYLLWAAAVPVVGIASWMLDGIYFGATWTREMRRAMIASVAIYAAALALLVPTMGNHGLWLSLMILNLARGITLAWSYPRLERTVGA